MSPAGARPVACIVAMTRDGLMGRGMQLPWRWPEDLKHFQRTTKGHAVIMGRATWESLNEQFGGPLKRRTNLVVSRSRGGELPHGRQEAEARWFRSLADAIAFAQELPASGTAADPENPAAGEPDEIFVLGGGQLFGEALDGLLPPPDRVIVTWVPDVPGEPGDTFFPFRPPAEFLGKHHAAARRWNDSSGQLEFVVYERLPS